MSTYASRCTDGDDYGGGGGGGFMQGELATISSKYAHLNDRLASIDLPPNTPGGTGRVDQALRPVTIKQVLDAEASNSDSAISIQDIDVTNVSFCGVVRDIVRNATNVLLQVGDGTGGIEARKWIDSSDGESEGFEAETGIQFRETDRSSSIPISLIIRDWVRVIGSPKLFNNKKTVAGLRVEKITDFNEINYRLLDAVRVTLAYERGATGAGDEMNIDQSTNHTTHGKIIQAKTPTELLIRIRSWSIFLAFNLLMRALTSTTLRGSAIWT
ncbi:replication factor A protein 2 [Puccinia graminis f. sp. tritici]|uniref:Replication factor A protein 2 n=1 Tax=Puccinia graminis f. sp. tritici TaxID=56615 RepID=A0A5B0NM25_PUCGR|nr:replication factor A protein 2 [Puccinia graminis f. sp. tritici]